MTGGSVADATTKASGGNAKVHGKKAQVAAYTPLDLTEEQRKALEGNMSNADSIEALLNRMVPGWSEMLKQGTGNAASLLRGEIPKDVQQQVLRSNAFQALQGGYAGSGMSKALTARDLGRTSLDMQGLGNNAAQQWSKLAQTSYSPFMIDTAMQANTTAANNAGIQQQKQREFNVEAAPDPAAAAKFAIDSAIGMQLLSFGMGAAGGAMAGGGGAAMGARGGGGSYNANTPYQYDPQTNSFMPIQQARPVWGG